MSSSEYKKNVSKYLIKKAQVAFADKHIVMVVPKFIAKSFHSYCSMKEDLKLVKKQIKLLSNNSNGKEVNAALIHSIIALYGKCFTDASSGKAPKLETTQIFQDADLIKTHEFLINLRHHFLAHRGETDSEIEAAFFLITKDEPTESYVQFMREKQIKFSKKQREDILKLLDFIDKILDMKISKAAKRVQKGMLNLDKSISKWTVINNAK